MGVFVGFMVALGVAALLTRGRGAALGFGRCLALMIALASSAATVFFVHVGHRAHWTSDGPGMLIVMLGVLVCGGVALTAWGGVLGGLAAPGEDDPPPRPEDRLKF